MADRILIVEDNPLNMKLTRVILQAAGYDTEGAVNADEAENFIRLRMPDLIVMDLGLPGKDGYALTRQLKSVPATCQIPILVLTSYAMNGDRAKAFEAGCNAYLSKPVDRVELLAQVRGLIDDGRAAESIA
jgi:CheY-like chemotaxis protein